MWSLCTRDIDLFCKFKCGIQMGVKQQTRVVIGENFLTAIRNVLKIFCEKGFAHCLSFVHTVNMKNSSLENTNKNNTLKAFILIFGSKLGEEENMTDYIDPYTTYMDKKPYYDFYMRFSFFCTLAWLDGQFIFGTELLCFPNSAVAGLSLQPGC